MKKFIFLFIAIFALVFCQCNSKKKHTIRDKSVLSFYNGSINDSLSASLYNYLYSNIKKRNLQYINDPNFYSIKNKHKLSKNAVEILVQFDIINIGIHPYMLNASVSLYNTGAYRISASYGGLIK